MPLDKGSSTGGGKGGRSKPGQSAKHSKELVPGASECCWACRPLDHCALLASKCAHPTEACCILLRHALAQPRNLRALQAKHPMAGRSLARL